ncbi:Uma2 family endonuclease [Paracraurococcus lichenis]|uniref:Uma2 family endonuclease n=1 Tax=Paracraurococcus lichenis TaxID=3064888 RepID=A0ABT9DYI1_9PROT|nr:Uma2 family endonuclease [Paracraurococcus sp. LOR1-02]MDO9708968.1 Uma2 family endonuclease [Paracraurococcus sp. LOR1-02]
MDGDRPSLLERVPEVRRHRLDVHEYYRMAEAGILTREDRVELIEGEIVDMVPIGSPHGGTVNALNYRLTRQVGDAATVSVQGPLRLSDVSEPQPDLMLLKPRPDFYRSGHPTAADVLLLVEVAQSSLAYDRKVKLPLYARHGVPEVWIVNLGEGVVEVHRTPKDETYQDATTAGRGDTLEPALLPGLRIAVAEVLG